MFLENYKKSIYTKRAVCYHIYDVIINKKLRRNARFTMCFHHVLRLPQDYREDHRYPLILFLHGAGTRGDDLGMLENNPFFKITEAYEDFPFLVAAPQCRANETWFDRFETLTAFAEHLALRHDVDPDRVYLMGASMGGYGTWQLAMSRPDLFAAIVPICGGGMYWNAGRLKDVPVWAFHGAKDSAVFAEESVKMVDAVNRCGGNAKLTVYPENGHNAWSDTYSNPEVFAWLLQHRNKNSGECCDEFNNSKIYG